MFIRDFTYPTLGRVPPKRMYIVVHHESILKEDIKKSFDAHKTTLEFTIEDIDEEMSLQYLDVRLVKKKSGVCWLNKQRSAKAVLPFRSSHGNPIKVGVVKGIARSALTKSCCHLALKSLNLNVGRLLNAGYEDTFIKRNLIQLALEFGTERAEWAKDRPVVAIQFSHYSGHWLKNLANDFGVLVVFKYGNKLAKLAPRTSKVTEKCKKSGHDTFVECIDRTVYKIPLSCGKSYIGQTERCVNRRLYEHKKSLTAGYASQSVALKKHLEECDGCEPEFERTVAITRAGSKRVREIVESAAIQTDRDNVISSCTVALNALEWEFLRPV